MWRALLEAICLGTRAAVEGLQAATGEAPSVLLAAGGATRSPFWLQMHADATGLLNCSAENPGGCNTPPAGDGHHIVCVRESERRRESEGTATLSGGPRARFVERRRALIRSSRARENNS